MKFLIDQDVYAITIHFVSDLGHDVIPVSKIGLSKADDFVLLKTAKEQSCIFITCDKDFGNLVFLQKIKSGVIYLRMLPSNTNAVHKELKRVLHCYKEKELQDAFIVVEPGRHRFRKL